MTKRLVVVGYGKGRIPGESAESYKIIPFLSKELAEDFCRRHTDTNSKYWSICKIIELEEEFSINYPEFEEDYEEE